METFVNIVIEVLRLIPLILVFYIPALLGIATWKERGEGYAGKAALWLTISFGVVVLIQLVLRSGSALQVLTTLGVSLFQMAVAVVFAALTVYKLAD